jgi:imidazole glycerol-phosphate synthase subunit HisH
MSRPAAIGIVDYGMGNRRSVQKAFEHVGAETWLTSDADRLRACDGLVVPGVGAFPQGMRNLAALGLDELIRGWDGPVLGICLGMQLLFDRSDELQPTDGLGLIAGGVRRLQAGGRRVPHIGWNEVRFERPAALTAGLPGSGCPFYHVHSYAAHPARPGDVIGTTDYGERFATIVAHGSVFGVQFHPEKSSADGLHLLRNFVKLCGAPASEPAGPLSLRA